ncbi:hypothetical protein [Deinococcus wulumuqiensis]|uniref:Uncharacterized protein n=1 Tax=Deinococcus wulumuqiensis TaxID=980427 RepID=A0AAV4K441_9DEIO|nr:hypothetical protein [Deinococcus wulumuqiensis]QII20190.1 hypothetical protein G6R31_04965 [Deinococcus wulumuqiensis R12]GGI75332.1 hypothetical protein GCM10010914_06940 [Deinococcus wulumuqiensis]GGP28710.1 hypothetical protein GCM10008021_03610 [Deinococcus wulumuqiensis]
MIRVFGVTAYPQLIQQPYRLLLRAAEIAGEREAALRLARVQDGRIADGMKLGRQWVPGRKEKADPDAGHWDLGPLLRHEEQLDRLARPWAHTPEAIERRLDAEQDAAFHKLFQAMKG